MNAIGFDINNAPARSLRKTLMLGAAICLALLLLGCDGGGGGGGSDSDAPAANVTGTWIAMDLTGDAGAILTLKQNGNSIGGSASDTEDLYPISGYIGGNEIHLEARDGDYSFSANAIVDGDTMKNGTWSDSEGDGGSWNATRQ